MLPQFKQHSVLPGFGLTLGFTLTYLSLIVLLPLATLVIVTASMSFADFWKVISSPLVIASFKLSFGTSLVAACLNAVFGFIVAWSLVRYRFPGRRFVDALIDIPFAMPTAVSGIALSTLYAHSGWIGAWFAPEGWIGAWFAPGSWYSTWFKPFEIEIVNSSLGIIVALTFIGLPFVVRTLQPALEDLDKEVEEAAESLGASKWQTFYRVIIPSVFPAWATGFTLALARALGEYGSVIFIAGNIPMKTEIVPVKIVQELLNYETAAATAIAVVMLAASFVLMFCINMIQWYARRRSS
ncbi:MAG: sulfate ABC transporter permease subunit CysT [Planctomycetaceae bacterium]|nr:sulfate ABC transporter permease subunit CysT [Planctomycetaceae bacterium]